jgi:very-short-patch-repair endonuclease
VRNRQLGGKFRRQQPIGKYIVDFVCFEKQLVIEIDGGEHFEKASDEIRDSWFQEQGYRVLRFWNNDALKNTDDVLACIINEISPSPLSPSILSMSVSRRVFGTKRNLEMRHEGGEVIVNGGN